ncbi:hypothetical protein BDW42DRAFT_168485 [Aspergillus taichungensis]|uniref:Uncharacterized protein n=1 Tax=Aspergillus taichungensis TaxID=482145 RepID=A0A2J5HWI9_9EURO|nr:hypothetical protein BDW42DRAFT_168485 [Aspergillus taichungensis]
MQLEPRYSHARRNMRRGVLVLPRETFGVCWVEATKPSPPFKASLDYSGLVCFVWGISAASKRSDCLLHARGRYCAVRILPLLL